MRLFLLTSLTMIAFAANSLLNRAALSSDAISAMDFALVRSVSGALMLALLLYARQRKMWSMTEVSPGSVLGLASYLIGFALAYQSLDAGTGALVLFGTVQIVMVLYGLIAGEKITSRKGFGMALALIGLLTLTVPGAAAPDLTGVVLMAAAGAGWGYYSIYGKGVSDPLAATAGNFLWAVPIAGAVWVATGSGVEATQQGMFLAVVSGAVTSGLGYALWYLVLPDLKRLEAALAQLSVPALAILGGMIFLAEQPGALVLFASALILGGIGISLKR